MSLISHWKLDGNATDSVGVNNGTTPPTSYVAGKIGQAANFNGTDYINCGTDPSLDMSTSLSLACWFKTSVNQSNKYLCGILQSSSNNNYDLRLDSNVIGFTLGIAPNLCDTSSMVYNDDTWRHVAATWDGTDAKIYINAVLANTVTMTGSLPSATSLFSIGAVGGIAGAKADIDDVRLYDNAISASDILALYNLGNPSNTSNFFQFF